MMAPGEGVRPPLALALLGASLLILFVAGAARAAVPSTIRIDPGTARRARAFWTPARMRAAKPVEVHPPHLAGIGAFARATEERGRAERAGATSSRASVPESPRFEQVPEPTAEGLRQNGVIFALLDEGLARCSGTSVSAPNFSVVYTAAHCIPSRGRTPLWVFVPGYRYGQRPFGVFPAKWLGTTAVWSHARSENGDVGAAVVMRNESGRRLGKAVGGAGIAWGLPPGQSFDVHGYPVAPPFDGETQRICRQTPFLGHDPESFLWPGPLDLAVDCDVTGGASGGGWTIHGDTLNGVTDYGYPDDPATDFGAYFGKEVERLYKRAAAIR
jgi:V8-like Glu-specific endopeptidase